MSQSSSTFECQLAERCSGCAWFKLSYQEQRNSKIEAFAKSWISAELPALDFKPRFESIDHSGLRDRVDLVIDNRTGTQRLGMFDQEHKEIVDIHLCPQLSPDLQSWLNDFRKIKWPISRGSVRLRVSPSGQRGVWLDFANEDVKKLFDERSLLENLLTFAFVEVGQRRKHLVQDGERLRLVDPQLQAWFETYIPPLMTSVSLDCFVGSFTQPGFRANKALIKEVFRFIKQIEAKSTEIKSVAEFGSGVGNFTLPLASQFKRVEAFEIDRLACSALEKNLKKVNLEKHVTIHQGDFQTISERRSFTVDEFDLVFVDPPRSGLKDFLKPFFSAAHRPKFFIYVSCYPDSFCKDAKQLYELGYQVESVTIVDQFPQTPHAELVSFFSRC